MAIWVPQKENLIAVVTVDSILVYDVFVSCTEPQFYFVLPTGKIKDCTFSNFNEDLFIYLLSFSGHIYIQNMTPETHASNGPFYITNTLDMIHPMITSNDGLILGGGSSIYFSHILQILCISFVSGHNFMVTLDSTKQTIRFISTLDLPYTNKPQNKAPQPLVGWMEPLFFPGLLLTSTATQQLKAFYLYPKVFKAHEFKISSMKQKICDYVLLNNRESKTTKLSLMVVYEDGSYRIFNSNLNNDIYWLNDSLISPCCHQTSVKLLEKELSGKPLLIQLN